MESSLFPHNLNPKNLNVEGWLANFDIPKLLLINNYVYTLIYCCSQKVHKVYKQKQIKQTQSLKTPATGKDTMLE